MPDTGFCCPPRTDQDALRIGILFKDVIALNLPTLVDDLSVEEVAASPQVRMNLGAWELGDRSVFSVRGGNCDGFVVASTTVQMADHGAFYDPSPLIQGPPYLET